MAETKRMNLIQHLARRFSLRQIIFFLILTFFLTSILFPFYWMVSSSFKSQAEIGGRQPVYFPSALRLDAYRELFDPSHPSFQNFSVNILNSLMVSVPTALIAVILSVLGAYAIARLKFKGKNVFFKRCLDGLPTARCAVDHPAFFDAG
jgi:multiple sugar transport system permease protein